VCNACMYVCMDVCILVLCMYRCMETILKYIETHHEIIHQTQSYLNYRLRGIMWFIVIDQRWKDIRNACCWR
jgi:hypothetical protein